MTQQALLTAASLRPLCIYFSLLFICLACQQETRMTNPIYRHQPNEFFTGPALPVAQAIRQNDTLALTKLLQAHSVDPNYVGKEGMSFCLWAYEHQFVGCLRVLVQQGANINQTIRLKSHKTGNFYNTHLINIAAVGPSDTVLLALLKLGANPSLKEQDSEPTLHNAVMARRYDRLRLLVEHGADVNMLDDADSPAIIDATRLNHFDQVVWLIEHGADYNKPENSLSVSLQETEADEPANLEWQRKLKRMLIERGVHFPIPRPWEQKYKAIEAQWAQTPEGQAWEEKVNRMGADPQVVGQAWQQEREGLMTALKQWMAANQIEEPEDPPYDTEKN